MQFGATFSSAVSACPLAAVDRLPSFGTGVTNQESATWNPSSAPASIALPPSPSFSCSNRSPRDSPFIFSLRLQRGLRADRARPRGSRLPRESDATHASVRTAIGAASTTIDRYEQLRPRCLQSMLQPREAEPAYTSALIPKPPQPLNLTIWSDYIPQSSLLPHQRTDKHLQFATPADRKNTPIRMIQPTPVCICKHYRILALPYLAKCISAWSGIVNTDTLIRRLASTNTRTTDKQQVNLIIEPSGKQVSY